MASTVYETEICSAALRQDNGCVTLKKYAIPRQIKPGILKLTFRRGQSNLSIDLFFRYEESGYFHIFTPRFGRTAQS